MHIPTKCIFQLLQQTYCLSYYL